MIFGLVLVNFFIYAQTLHFQFITFDDPVYVYENPAVQRTSAWEAVRWAFTTFEAANWHPLTWLSLWLDHRCYGLNAGGYHLTNVLLHQINTVTLFLFLRVATGAFWRSAVVAALFAAHPLHVESVAWVTERKDVLCGAFFFGMLLAYAHYTRTGERKRWLGVALGLYTLGLMAKPMLVTVPPLLLLLDGWPLRRFAGGGWPRVRWLLWEKIPFAALALVSSVVTCLAQKAGGAVVPLERWTLSQRVVNAGVAYGAYIRQTFWPTGISLLYQREGFWIWWELLGVGVGLIALSALALARWKRWPFLGVGWGWFLGTLLPVIGLVQVGGQARADRYTYLPHVGLFIAVVWTSTCFVPWKAAHGRVADGRRCIHRVNDCGLRRRGPLANRSLA